MANYNDDFSSYPIATGVPTGFTARWVTANVTHSIVDSAGDDDNKTFRQNRSATGRGLVTMDAVDGDANRANSEILVRVKLNNPSGGTASAGPALRCSGTAGNESGYVCYPIGNKLRVTWYKGGVSNTDHRESATLTLTDGAFYWIRFRVENTSTPIALKARMWSGLLTDENTSSWQVDTTETNIGGTSITAAGWSGMFAFGATTWDTDAIAVGTNGDTASMSSGGNTDLVVAAATHGHVVDNVTLGATGETPLAIAEANHAHTVENLVVSVNNVVSVGPLKNNTGTVLASESGITVHVYQTSGALVVTKTAQTTNASGIISLSDAAIVPGTTYRVVIVMSGGAEGMDKVTA